MKIRVVQYTGDFAENKDVAKDLRINYIMPYLLNEGILTIDFDGVSSATQSFIHALISEIIRGYGVNVLEKIEFKNCNQKIRTLISIVVTYVQDGIFMDDDEVN